MNKVKLFLATVFASIGAISTQAHAAIDTAAATASIAEASPAVAAIGGAIFAVIIGIAVWKWMRRVVN